MRRCDLSSLTGRGSGTTPGHRTPIKRKRKSAFYWAFYRDADGNDRHHVLVLPNGEKVRDKEIAREQLRSIMKREARKAAGLVDKEIDSAGLPIRKVIADYIRHLRTLHRRQQKPGRQYIKQAVSCLKWIAEQTGVQRLTDFNEEHVARAMGLVVDAGRSIRTANGYRAHALQLGRFLVKPAKLWPRNAISDVELYKVTNEKKDLRKRRRALWPDEATRLMAVAGPRRLFYGVQMLTGLRVNEARLLQWSDVCFGYKAKDGQSVPSLQLRAETTKNRQADRIPLHWRLVKELLAVRPPGAAATNRVFRSTPTRITFLSDLKRAKIPVADAEGRTLDRHALRTTFVSWLGQLGVDIRVARLLARHKPRDLTTGTYQDKDMLDLPAQEAVNRLPDVFIKPGRQRRRATGTNNRSSAIPDTQTPVAVGVAAPSDFDRQNASASVAHTGDGNEGDVSRKPANSSGNDAVLRRPSSSDGNGRYWTRTSDLLLVRQAL